MDETEVEAARKKFIGNIKTDKYTVEKSAGKAAQKIRLFYNGVELKEGDTITIKTGKSHAMRHEESLSDFLNRVKDGI